MLKCVGLLDLMALLESRGLVISDEAKAVRYLESIGYYRLSAYMYPFLKAPKETKNSYCDPYPPSWILGELLTMGNVNMVYRNLKADKIRKRISHYFGLQPIVLESWITSLTLLRNACCHHSRVWNKVSSIMPVSPRRIAHSWITLPTNPQRVYFTICIIKYFLDIISPNNDMLDKMNRLFATFPEIDKAALGFPSGWENEPLWQ